MLKENLFQHSTARHLTLPLLMLGYLVTDATAAPSSRDDIALTEILSGDVAKDKERPRFKVDAAWPHLPETMLLGQVRGYSLIPWMASGRYTDRNP